MGMSCPAPGRAIWGTVVFAFFETVVFFFLGLDTKCPPHQGGNLIAGKNHQAGYGMTGRLFVFDGRTRLITPPDNAQPLFP
jgi:hypothetical protein